VRWQLSAPHRTGGLLAVLALKFVYCLDDM
jgi:hypothetical protein